MTAPPGSTPWYVPVHGDGRYRFLPDVEREEARGFHAYLDAERARMRRMLEDLRRADAIVPPAPEPAPRRTLPFVAVLAVVVAAACGWAWWAGGVQ